MKRKHSQTPEQENKRARTSPGREDDVPTPAVAKDVTTNNFRRESQDTAPTAPARNGSATQTSPAPQRNNTNDRQRTTELPKRQRKPVDPKELNKRLFGNALGTIAGKSTDRQSKRRQELEERKKAEKEKRDAQEAEERAKNYEKLKVHRRREQINVDEEVMKTKHRSMLHRANFLWTQTEPKLSYRPYELTPEQEETISQQIEEAQREVDRELVEFESKKLDALAALDGEMSGVGLESVGVRDSKVAGKEDGGGAMNRTVGMAQCSEDAKDAHKVDQHAHAPLSRDTNLSVEGDIVAYAGGDAAMTGVDDDLTAPGKEGFTKHEDKEAEENAEHVYEGDEDTLIY